MPRLNIERQNELEPKRIEFAKMQIEKLGYQCEIIGKAIVFTKAGCKITFFPYSGWATGTSIIDGRGLNNLLKQL